MAQMINLGRTEFQLLARFCSFFVCWFTITGMLEWSDVVGFSLSQSNMCAVKKTHLIGWILLTVGYS